MSVIVEQRQVKDKPWGGELWEVIGVISAQAATEAETSADAPEKTVLRRDESSVQYLWNGFAIELFKDEAESYYANLRGRNTGVFVICHESDESPELIPQLVSLSYDDAVSHMEVDEPVFNVAVPREIYLWLERYVLDTYQPEEKKKRKRKNWRTDERPPPRVRARE